MLWKLFSSTLCEPSDEEVDLLLRQALAELSDHVPPDSAWQRLRTRIAAPVVVDPDNLLNTIPLADRRVPCFGSSCPWEALMRPQSWSRLAI